MKKTFVLLAAAVLAILPLAAKTPDGPEPADVKMVTKSYNFSGFTGLQAGWTYQVALTCAAHYTVRVEAPDFVVPYLDVRVNGDRLVLDVKEMPRDIRKQVEMVLKHNEIRAWVAMPALTDLRLSGAARLDASGEFSARQDKFRLELSGAASLRGLAVEAAEADIRSSGAAKYTLRGAFNRSAITLSGATGGDLTLQGKEAVFRMSGAVKTSLKADLERLEIEASGAVNFQMDGAAATLDTRASGASKIDLLGAPADKARVRLSGAANAGVSVRQTLDVDLSGAASCRYKAGPDLRITNQSVSRGATLRRL